MNKKDFLIMRDEKLELGRQGTSALMELAALLGVSHETVRRYGTGERPISAQSEMHLKLLLMLKKIIGKKSWKKFVKRTTQRRKER